MGRILALVPIVVIIAVAAMSYAVAQDAPATPDADVEVCASPEASPASPQASPSIDTDATPGVVATEVLEAIAGGLDDVVCGTPLASPAT